MKSKIQLLREQIRNAQRKGLPGAVVLSLQAALMEAIAEERRAKDKAP